MPLHPTARGRAAALLGKTGKESSNEARIEKETNSMEIGMCGDFGSPSVVTHGEVTRAGKVPSKEEVQGENHQG